MIAWRRRQRLIFAGYSEAEIIFLGDLTKLTNKRMNELMHCNKLQTLASEELDKSPDISQNGRVAASLLVP